MDLTPLPGRTAEELSKNLEYVRNTLVNTRRGRAAERVAAFLAWAADAARMLRYLLAPTDVEALIFTPGYSRVLTVPAIAPEKVLNDLVTTETDDRLAVLDAALTSLDSYRKRWAGAGQLVIFDTNVYLHQPDHVTLETLDIPGLLGVDSEPIRLLIPIVVVDELDGLKQHDKSRSTARRTLAYLDSHLADGLTGRIREAGPSAHTFRGDVTAEIVFDPPGHQRLTITDDEIIDRAMAIQALAGRPVRMVTFDLGMAMRARGRGLIVQKLGDPPN